MSKNTTEKTGANLVTSAQPDSLELTVYQHGDAVVHESRTVELASGKNHILLEGLPQQFVEDSFEISEVGGPGNFKLGPDSFSPADLSVQALLQKAVGGRITFIEQTQQGVLRHTGKLVHLLGNQVVLETAEGFQILSVTPKFELPDLPKGLSATPALMLEPSVSEAGAYVIDSMYETGGLSWSARYSIRFDEKSGLVTRLACRVKLTNETGANYEDAVFKLLAAANSSRARSGMRPKGGMARAASFESAMPMAAAMAAPEADSAQVESVGEQKLYVLSEALSIRNGQTKRPYLHVASDVKPETVELYLPATYGYYPATAQGKDDDRKLPVFIRLRLRNDREHNLGFALPAGDGAVFQPDSSGKYQKTDPHINLPATADGEAFKVDLSTPSSDVKATRRLVEFHQDPEVEEVEEVTPEGGLPDFPITTPGGPDVGTPGHHSRVRREVAESAGRGKKKETKPAPRFRREVREVTVFNFKDKDVEVLVQEWLPGDDFELLNSTHDFAEKATSQGTFRVSVPAKGKSTLTYALKWQIN